MLCLNEIVANNLVHTNSVVYIVFVVHLTSFTEYTLLFYSSWDVGNAHFILFSTEVYFFFQYGPELVRYQYEWLEKDLKVCVCVRVQRTL